VSASHGWSAVHSRNINQPACGISANNCIDGPGDRLIRRSSHARRELHGRVGGYVHRRLLNRDTDRRRWRRRRRGIRRRHGRNALASIQGERDSQNQTAGEQSKSRRSTIHKMLVFEGANRSYWMRRPGSGCLGTSPVGENARGLRLLRTESTESPSELFCLWKQFFHWIFEIGIVSGAQLAVSSGQVIPNQIVEHHKNAGAAAGLPNFRQS
jgi:hypothetical protein